MKHSNTSNIILSSNRNSSHLGDAAIPSLRTTAIPLREEFRCRRFWFFHHDTRAFTMSVSKGWGGGARGVLELAGREAFLVSEGCNKIINSIMV